jgi:hypothetical protein
MRERGWLQDNNCDIGCIVSAQSIQSETKISISQSRQTYINNHKDHQTKWGDVRNTIVMRFPEKRGHRIHSAKRCTVLAPHIRSLVRVLAVKPSSAVPLTEIGRRHRQRLTNSNSHPVSFPMPYERRCVARQLLMNWQI